MSASRTFPWLRILVEGIVIVASILAAFAADRWWERRVEMDAERGALESLRAEMQGNLDRIDELVEQRRYSEQAALHLVRIIDGHVPMHTEPVDSLLWATFLDVGTFEAKTGVSDGLISTGRLSIIQNEELRTLLAGWRGEIADAEEEDQWVVNDIQTLFRPYLVRTGLLRPAERVYESFRDVGPGDRAYDFSVILEDVEFEGLVLLRLEDERISIDEYDDLRADAEAIMELVESELADGAR